MSYSKEPKITFKTFEDQNKFIDNALSLKYRYLCFAGSVRSGKTSAIMTLLIVLGIAFTGSKWYVVRKDVPTLKRTTIPTFHLVCPKRFLKNFNKSELIAEFYNGSQILFMGENASEDPDCNRFKGLEANGFFLSQAEELRKLTFETCKMRSGQWKLPEWRNDPDKMPPSLILLDANPCQNWLKTLFYTPWRSSSLPENMYFQQADIFKNPYLDQEYLEGLKDLPIELYNRFVKNNWEAVEDLNQLIPWEYIHQCRKRIREESNTDQGYYMGVDVGHLGNDKTNIYILKGYNIFKRISYDKTRTTDVADIVEKLIMEFNINSDNVTVDAVGIGAGVVDELLVRGYRVVAMRGGDTAVLKKYKGSNLKFKNWKALSYWIAREQLKKKTVGNFSNDLLVSDAGAIWYYIRGEKEIYVESKQELKKRIGRSCDDWDAFVYAIWSREKHNVLSTGVNNLSFISKTKDMIDQEEELDYAEAETI